MRRDDQSLEEEGTLDSMRGLGNVPNQDLTALALLDKALSGSPLTVWIQDEDLRYIYHSPLPEQSVQVQMLGHSARELLVFGKEDADSHLHAMEGVLADGRTRKLPSELETRLGQMMRVEVTYQALALPGGRPCLLCHATDLGRSKEATRIVADLKRQLERNIAQLKLSEQRIHMALTGVPLTLYMQDEELRFVWAYNVLPPLKTYVLIGLKETELPGWQGEKPSLMISTKLEVLASGNPAQLEHRIDLPAGGRGFFRCSYSRCILEDGRPGLLAQVLDITQERLAEEALREMAVEMASQSTQAILDMKLVAKRTQELLSQNLAGTQALEALQIVTTALQSQIEEAREMQLSMLPQRQPIPAALYTVAAHMRTSLEVGGDYYDYLPIPGPDGVEYAVTLGDATGHGVKSAMMVVAVKSFFHVLAPIIEPVEVLRQIDDRIEFMRLKRVFMGLSLLRLSRTGRVVYASAGMPPLCIYRARTGLVETIHHRTLFLGTRIESRYRQQTIQLEPGDTLVLLSDGYTEVRNPAGITLPEDQLCTGLATAASAGPEAVLEAIRSLQFAWSGTEEVEDDSTAVVIRYNGSD